MQKGHREAKGDSDLSGLYLIFLFEESPKPTTSPRPPTKVSLRHAAALAMRRFGAPLVIISLSLLSLVDHFHAFT